MVALKLRETFTPSADFSATQEEAGDAEATAYRGETPQNTGKPHIGRLEMSSAQYNPTGVPAETVYGNRYRQQVKENAIRRLGIEDGKPAYLLASNITKNGQEYYVDVTKASLNKMLYTQEHEMLPIERILLVDNLEKAIDNSYWAESSGDRKGRPQIDGFDTLRTSFYVDNTPYYADIKVKVVQGKNGADSQNVVYFLEPEEITAIKRADAPSPTGVLLEHNIVFRDGTSTNGVSVPQRRTDVNTRLRMPTLTDAEGNVLYKKAEGYDAASDRPTATPQDTIADIEPSIDSIAQTEGAVNEVEMPVMQEAETATEEADTAQTTRQTVEEMDAEFDAMAEEARAKQQQREAKGYEMPETLRRLGVDPFGSEADYAGAETLAREARNNNSARKQIQKQISKMAFTEKERTFARLGLSPPIRNVPVECVFCFQGSRGFCPQYLIGKISSQNKKIFQNFLQKFFSSPICNKKAPNTSQRCNRGINKKLPPISRWEFTHIGL